MGVLYYRSILVGAGSPMFANAYGGDQRRIFSDLNLFWDTTRAQPLLNRGNDGKQEWDLQQWQRLGHDLHSRIAEPGFADAAAGDFTLAADSPALGLGFQPIDLSDVGPRAAGQRE